MGSKYVVGNIDERVAQLVLEANPMMELGDYPYTGIGQMDASGVLVGGVILNTYTKTDVHLHVAATDRRWLTRRFIGEVFRHIFVKLGCTRCTGIVAESNLRAQLFDEKLGFTHEGTLRRYLPDGQDARIYGMLLEECRWLNVGELDGRKRDVSTKRPPTVAGLQRSAGPEQRSRITAALGPRRAH